MCPRRTVLCFCQSCCQGFPVSLSVTGRKRKMALQMESAGLGWHCSGGENQNMNGAPVCPSPGGSGRHPEERYRPGMTAARLSPSSFYPRIYYFLSIRFLFGRAVRWYGRKAISGLGWTSYSLEVCVHEVFNHLVSWKADNLGSNSFQQIC